jgi:hypothetical protein
MTSPMIKHSNYISYLIILLLDNVHGSSVIEGMRYIAHNVSIEK